MFNKNVWITLMVFALLAILNNVSYSDTRPSLQSLQQQIKDLQEGIDPPCWNGGHRFVDCGNGTVTDWYTGLVWLKEAGCIGVGSDPTNDSRTSHSDAVIAAAQLKSGICGLNDHSHPGDWRLPTLAEWKALIDPIKQACAKIPSIPNCYQDFMKRDFFPLFIPPKDHQTFDDSFLAFWVLEDGLSNPMQMGVTYVVIPNTGQFIFVESQGSPSYAWPVRKR